MIAAYPDARTLARANRRFLISAVWYLADHGIRQYADFGSGLPTSPNVHEVARQVRPDAPMVYVDNDPMVATHGRALCADNGVAFIEGDIRYPQDILTRPAGTGPPGSRNPAAVRLAAGTPSTLTNRK